MSRRRRSVLAVPTLTGRTYQHWRLPNGIRLAVEYIPSAYSVAIGVWILAGSRDETPEYNGVAHLVEHLVAGSSQRYSAYRLAAAFEELGADVNAYTTKELTCYVAQALHHHVPRVLQLFAEQLLHPRLNRRAVERERRIITEELRSYADDPEEVLYEHTERLLFGEHPLGMPIAGTTETVERITDEVAADFHRRFYVGERTVITVAGNLPLEELSGAISEAWSVLPPLREPLPERMPPSERPPQDAELRRPFQQAYVALARLVLQPTPKERMALALLNFLLGEGWSSRLYQRIRERHGLVYSILSELEWYADCGLWSIVASTNPTALPRVERLVRDELNRLAAEGIRPDEFRRGCTFLQARMAMALDNPAECMALLARAALEGTPTTPHHALQLMAELSPEDVNAAALRWCPSEQWSTVRLLPTE